MEYHAADASPQQARIYQWSNTRFQSQGLGVLSFRDEKAVLLRSTRDNAKRRFNICFSIKYLANFILKSGHCWLV